jgi:integrase
MSNTAAILVSSPAPSKVRISEPTPEAPARKVPTYRRKGKLAVVTLPDGAGGRRDVMLGKFGSKDSRVQYARVVAEWEARGRTWGDPKADRDMPVNELIEAFIIHAAKHYRHADGTPTKELADYKYSLRPLKELYGHSRACEFGPLALEAVRQRMIDLGWSRGVINQRVGRIKRVFRWGVSKEIVPAVVLTALEAMQGLQRGRTDARETEPVKPVPVAFVDAIREHVLPEVWGMVQLQLLTGMRPGEVCMMRPGDLDTSSPIWTYRPARHKTTWRGKSRVISIGPRAQVVIRGFLPLDVSAFVFSPRRAMEEKYIRLRKARQTPVQPSQVSRRKRKPQHIPSESYKPEAYATAIARGCVKAGVPHWHPNQLRHNHGTEVRRQFGLESAGAALGHSKMSATEIYAERDRGLAERVAAAIG